jgi:hypothetical protein
MSDDHEIIRRAAFLQTQSACAIIEALAEFFDCLSVRHQGIGNGADRIRAVIDRHGIGHNAALTFLEGA